MFSDVVVPKHIQGQLGRAVTKNLLDHNNWSSDSDQRARALYLQHCELVKGAVCIDANDTPDGSAVP